MCAAAVPGHEARTSTGGGLGAYLGHEPSDNSGHERTAAESQISWAHLVCEGWAVQPGGQVQVLDIDREGLAGPGGRLIQQPPQRLLPHADILPAPQLLQLGEGNGLGAVRRLWPALEVDGEVLDQPAAPSAEPQERADGGYLAIPGRRGPPTPCGRHRDHDRLHGKRRQRSIAAELAHQPGEGLVIAAAGGSGQARLGEKRLGGRAEGLLGGC